MIWLILFIYVVGVFVAMVAWGYAVPEKDDVKVIGVMISIMWPLFLVFVVFYWICKMPLMLGEWLAEDQKK